MECPICGCNRIERGELTSPYGLTFKCDSSKFLFSKQSTVTAKVCLECGKLFDFRVKDIDKLNK